MDVPAEYHTLMKQAYGLTSPELSQTNAKYQKKKDAKSKKAASKTESSLSLKAARAAKTKKAVKIEMPENGDSIDADGKLFVPPYLQRRDRALSCIDLTQSGNDDADNFFKRRSLQRKSFHVKSSLTKRFKEVHKSLTSLVTEPENPTPALKDAHIPSTAAPASPVSPPSPNPGPLGSLPTNPSNPPDRPVPLPPVWSLATDPLTLLREAYHRQPHRRGAGAGPRRSNSVRVRAVRRNKSFRRSWDPRLADLMETSGQEGDEAADAGEQTEKDTTTVVGNDTGNGAAKKAEADALKGKQISHAAERKPVVRSQSMHQVRKSDIKMEDWPKAIMTSLAIADIISIASHDTPSETRHYPFVLLN